MDKKSEVAVALFVVMIVLLILFVGAEMGRSAERNSAQFDIEKVSELLQGYEKCEIITAIMHKDKNDTVILECR